MSILIQFIKDNMALFVFTIIAVVVLVGAVAAYIVLRVLQKRKNKAESAAEASEKPHDGNADEQAPTADADNVAESE